MRVLAFLPRPANLPAGTQSIAAPTPATLRPLLDRDRMARRKYQNPPVHEIILDLQFKGSVSDEQLEAVGDLVGETFGQRARFGGLEIEGELSPFTAPTIRTKSALSGWAFSEDDPDRLLRVGRQQITLHFHRSEGWPAGSYVGWEAIFHRYTSALDRLAPIFGQSTARRAGLRYLNRIAVPKGTDLDRWLTIGPRDLDAVSDLWSFEIRQTWARVVNDPRLSATLRLSRIEVENEDLRTGHHGILLDIDVFNLRVKEAPSYDDAGSWFEAAHVAENQLFESCITPELRSLFDEK